jgi:hypothetical protein
MQQVLDALEAERAEVQERLGWLERQISEFRQRLTGDSETPSATPAPKPRSRGRATARRASSRRATARERRGDIKAQIVAFLRDHPESTAGDVAKGIDANRNTTATRLSQMTKDGEISKASKGYVAK